MVKPILFRFSWDVFRRVAREHILDKDDKPQFTSFVQFCRLLIYVVLFFVVLLSVVMSRVSFLTLMGAWKNLLAVERPLMSQLMIELDIKDAYHSYSHFLVLGTILTPTVLWLGYGLMRLAFSGKQKFPNIFTILLVCSKFDWQFKSIKFCIVACLCRMRAQRRSCHLYEPRATSD